MPNSKDTLLIEIGTEELPPKSLKRTISSLKDNFEKGLKEAQLEYSTISAYATPRRLSLLVSDLADSQPTQSIERRGPSLKAALDSEGNPSKAVSGFMRSCGINSIDELVHEETEKGIWLVYKNEKPGATLNELLPNILSASISKLPIDRKMRWGANRVEFVRPVKWFVSLYGKNVIPMTILGLGSDNRTMGHRFMSNGEIVLNQADQYQKTLRDAKVIVDFEERSAIISQQLADIAEQQKAKVVIDESLLDEVSALVEWPVALLGHFDPEFLEVPEEALISAMKEHQRYFHLIDDAGKLLPMFVTVSNIESSNPSTVISGNERVIAPRLSDARFFYTQDQKTTLEEKSLRLSQIVFQSKLGTYLDKANRVSKLASYIAEQIGADPSVAERAGMLCKADLVSDMVGEFPDLQGLMGGYYAKHDGEIDGVAEAIEDHYKPTASGGELPRTSAGQCVSLADKLDTLTGLFGIGQPPTGSKDPFALRRQTLGIIRICIENSLNLDINDLISKANQEHNAGFDAAPVLSYMQDRMGTWYQGTTVTLDTFNAIQKSVKPINNFSEANDRIRSLQEFRSHEQANALISANKRISNILSKSDFYDLKSPDPKLFIEDCESTLFSRLEETSTLLTEANDIEAQLILLADCQGDIDDYFEQVMVMADDEKIRSNRLATLNQLRTLFLNVADFSVLQD